ncbi:MAG: phosphatase PAP2 family protein, partial [Anaerolineaceae bacterium]
MPVYKKRRWMIAVIVCLLAFGLLAAAYTLDWGMDELDLAFGSRLVSRTNPAGRAFFGAVTILGDTNFVTPLAILIGVVFIFKKQWQRLIIFALAIVGSWQLNNLLKMLFARPRPAYLAAPHDLISFSFPSGHAMIAVLMFGVLTYLLMPLLKQKAARLALLVGAIVLTLLVGFSRLYLGVHYLSDV